MKTLKIKELYRIAFENIDKGKTYKEMSDKTGIPIELLKIEHIKQSKERKDYQKNIKIYTLNLIKKHGVKVLVVENINKLTLDIPYNFRSAVKHLVYNLKKEVGELNALS